MTQKPLDEDDNDFGGASKLGLNKNSSMNATYIKEKAILEERYGKKNKQRITKQHILIQDKSRKLRKI